MNINDMNLDEIIHCIAELSESVQEGAFFLRASHYTENPDKMRRWFENHYATASSAMRIIAASSAILSAALADGEASIVSAE